MKKYLLLFFYFLLFTFYLVNAQDSLINYLINRIAFQQTSGTFPSYITNSEHFSSHQKDNNIFFTGLIDYTLQNIKPMLDDGNSQKINAVIQKSIPVFKSFKNRNGRNTYNFWRTDSAFVFPYTKWIRYLKKSPQLPDDMDDTVFSLFALNTDDSSADSVHHLMQSYINSDSNKVQINNVAYKNYAAYSTWFGKKFPVVFDVCVMSNVLSFIQTHDLKWTNADSASLNFILETINNKDCINHPLSVSPYYAQTSIILYHLARLMNIKPIAALENMKPELIATAVNEFQSTDNILEKIILCSAIMKWGYTSPEIKLPAENEIENSIERNGFAFFTGNIPSYLNETQRKILLSDNLGLFYHYSPSYNDALLLEYLALKNAKQF